MSRGRPKAEGFIIYLGRLRVIPDQDPPALIEFARAWEQADPEQKQAMLLAALIGGLTQSPASSVSDGEDPEMTDLLDAMLAEF